MPLGDTNISVSGIKTEMAIGSPNNVSGLNTYTTVNPYSFWSPRGLIFNAGTKVLEPVTDTAPYKMGDFRRYNHAASTPTVRATPNTALSVTPATNVYVPLWVDFFEVNLRRADVSLEITKVGVSYHTSLADAQANTSPISLVGGGTVSFHPISYTNREIRTGVFPSPALSGHTVTQTTAPSSSSVLVSSGSDGANKQFPSSGIGTTALPRWARMNFYDVGDNIKGTFATNIMAFTIREMTQPTQALQTQNPFYAVGGGTVLWDAGATVSATVIIATSQVLNNIAGDTSWNFSFVAQGLFSATYANVSGTVQVKYLWLGVWYNIGGARTITEGISISVTDAISGGISNITYDQDITIGLYYTDLATSYNEP